MHRRGTTNFGLARRHLCTARRLCSRKSAQKYDVRRQAHVAVTGNAANIKDKSQLVPRAVSICNCDVCFQIYDKISSSVISPTRSPPWDSFIRCREVIEMFSSLYGYNSASNQDRNELLQLLSRPTFLVSRIACYLHKNTASKYSESYLLIRLKRAISPLCLATFIRVKVCPVVDNFALCIRKMKTDLTD